ncbi:hypothetical protein HNY73_002649 [Argiope bruennichi]|uniref:Uncharacterized protein n=1 Tax=Argiope bruennichi TaxID=94029 RepID=A0A8T0FYI6_ARGBR|nr:hypothetical protein HNY73_002649 [Argiope bruennichi]
MEGIGRISVATKESIKHNKSEIVKSWGQEYPAKTNIELEANGVTTAALKSSVSSSAKTSMKYTGTEILTSSMKTSTTSSSSRASEGEKISTITMKSTMDDSTETSNIPDEKTSTVSSSSDLDVTLEAEEAVNSEIKLDRNSSKDELVKHNVLKVIRRSGFETALDEDTNSKINTTINADKPIFIDDQSDSKAIDNSKNNNSRSSGNLTAFATDRTGEMPSVITNWSDSFGSDLETDNGSNSNIGDNSDLLLEPQIIIEEANKNDILESYTAFVTKKSTTSVSKAETFSDSDTSIESLNPNSSEINIGDDLVEDTSGEISQIEVDRFD